MNQYGYETQSQPMPLFDIGEVEFDGPAYEPERDQERLTGQINRVYTIMFDHGWLTLSEIHELILGRFGKYDSEASISAQLRHLRKNRFGSHVIDKRRRTEGGLWEYRLVK